ncbi:S-layer homology domain-containing protein [Paenibacillus sp. KN14-4R]|uniref:S-layer homology domain-containing protein n=1 Tax=Paenibacillus sp. KN14-4R TaxID=3445773 RepID=UPI003FA109EB
MMKSKKGILLGTSMLVAVAGFGLIGNGSLLQAKSEDTRVSAVVSKSFTDIQSHWAEKDIVKAVESGIASGYEDGTFRPDNNVTRAEFIKLMASSLKLPVQNGGSNWYDRYVEAATKAGFYKNDFTVTSLDEVIPRKEMSMLAGRAAGLKYEYGAIEDKQWMWEAAKVGIIHGEGNGEVSPDGSTTRAQAIAIVNRVTDIKAGKKLPVDKYAISGAEIYWHKTNIMSMLPRYFSKMSVKGSNSNEYEKFRDDLMYVEEADGNYIAETEKFVVIDLDDPNDPNRHLIPDGSKRYDVSNRKVVDLPTNNAYVVVSVNKLTVKKNVANFDSIMSAYAKISSRLSDVNDSTNRRFQLDPLEVNDPNQFSNGVLKVKENSITTYVTGQIFPKGNYVSEPFGKIIFNVISKFNRPIPELMNTGTKLEINN